MIKIYTNTAFSSSLSCCWWCHCRRLVVRVLKVKLPEFVNWFQKISCFDHQICWNRSWVISKHRNYDDEQKWEKVKIYNNIQKFIEFEPKNGIEIAGKSDKGFPTRLMFLSPFLFFLVIYFIPRFPDHTRETHEFLCSREVDLSFFDFWINTGSTT